MVVQGLLYIQRGIKAILKDAFEPSNVVASQAKRSQDPKESSSTDLCVPNS